MGFSQKGFADKAVTHFLNLMSLVSVPHALAHEVGEVLYPIQDQREAEAHDMFRWDLVGDEVRVLKDLRGVLVVVRERGTLKGFVVFDGVLLVGGALALWDLEPLKGHLRWGVVRGVLLMGSQEG